jgi:predicted enzyme related to lactoylglutathione lyase
MTDKPTVVWTEIPVRDLDKGMAFYSGLFGWKMQRDDTGPNPMANFTDDMAMVSGHLYPGKPATSNGPTIHLAVPGKLEPSMKRCADLGGKVVSPIVTIPPGRYAYATDPDGNSIGLFEPAA